MRNQTWMDLFKMAGSQMTHRGIIINTQMDLDSNDFHNIYVETIGYGKSDHRSSRVSGGLANGHIASFAKANRNGGKLSES